MKDVVDLRGKTPKEVAKEYENLATKYNLEDKKIILTKKDNKKDSKN